MTIFFEGLPSPNIRILIITALLSSSVSKDVRAACCRSANCIPISVTMSSRCVTVYVRAASCRSTNYIAVAVSMRGCGITGHIHSDE